MPFSAQDGVEHVAVIDVVDRDPMSFLRDTPGEASAERDAHALVDLVLDAPRGRGNEELTGRIQQQHRGGVDRHQLADLVEQLVEQPVHGQLGQPGVGDRLKPPQPLLRRVRRSDLHRHSKNLTADPTTTYRRTARPGLPRQVGRRGGGGGCLYGLVKPRRDLVRASPGRAAGRACGRGAWRR